MTPHKQDDHNDRLIAVLRAARPAPALPPRFQAGVWRRIEHPEQDNAALNWVEILAGYLLKPRLAFATATALIVMGLLLGSLNGAAQARQSAQQRYVAAVVMPVAP
jgi:hypothetical protein